MGAFLGVASLFVAAHAHSIALPDYSSSDWGVAACNDTALAGCCCATQQHNSLAPCSEGELIVCMAQEIAGRQVQVASAQSDQIREDGTQLWIVTCSFFVFFMQCGFAMLEAGAVRRRNTQNIIFKNIVDTNIAAVTFYCIGYGLAYGESVGRFIGSNNFFLMNEPRDEKGQPFFFFQYCFAATAATIVSGAIAERTRFFVYCLSTFIITLFIYPVVVHWVWSPNGWLSSSRTTDRFGPNGMIDFAGSGVVHCVGGFAALCGTIAAGPRTGRFDLPVGDEGNAGDQAGKSRHGHRGSGAGVGNPLPDVALPQWAGLSGVSPRDIHGLTPSGGHAALVQQQKRSALAQQSAGGPPGTRSPAEVAGGLPGTRSPPSAPSMEKLDSGMRSPEDPTIDPDRRLHGGEFDDGGKGVRFSDGPADAALTLAEAGSIRGQGTLISALGVLILWFGWYGFNCGSTLAFNGPNAGKIATTTTLSSATGSLLCTLISKVHKGYYDIDAGLNGILAGLVSITAGCGVVDEWCALVIGAVGACVYYLSAELLLKLRIDDVVNAWPVHGACGSWGVIAVGIFAQHHNVLRIYKLNNPDAMSSGKQLGVQCVGLLCIISWTMCIAGLMFFIIVKTIGMRVAIDAEIVGLDFAEHASRKTRQEANALLLANLNEVAVLAGEGAPSREAWQAWLQNRAGNGSFGSDPTPNKTSGSENPAGSNQSRGSPPLDGHAGPAQAGGGGPWMAMAPAVVEPVEESTEGGKGSRGEIPAGAAPGPFGSPPAPPAVAAAGTGTPF